MPKNIGKRKDMKSREYHIACFSSTGKTLIPSTDVPVVSRFLPEHSDFPSPASADFLLSKVHCQTFLTVLLLWQDFFFEAGNICIWLLLPTFLLATRLENIFHQECVCRNFYWDSVKYDTFFLNPTEPKKRATFDNNLKFFRMLTSQKLNSRRCPNKF